MPQAWLERERELVCRRQAIQIASQLPDDPDESRMVLDFARQLVDFMSPRALEVRLPQDRPVIPFRGPVVRSND